MHYWAVFTQRTCVGSLARNLGQRALVNRSVADISARRELVCTTQSGAIALSRPHCCVPLMPVLFVSWAESDVSAQHTSCFILPLATQAPGRHEHEMQLVLRVHHRACH